jgi:phosphotransferase system enzyme I (PtsP)
MTQIPSKSAGTPVGPAAERGPGWSDTRLLLRRLREVMASEADGEARLNHMVRLVASNMVTEVCSVYLRRAGDVLELFATHGLNPDAVHQTRLRVGEGVIGDVALQAKALALSDARAHPSFAYRPETGEEEFHSMLGVPVLRGGRVIGVLAVQNRTQRHYTEDEIETLQTIAMVTAELVNQRGFISAAEMRLADSDSVMPERLTGIRLNGGPAIGRAVLHQPRPVIRAVIADDMQLEEERLKSALNRMHTALDSMLEDTALQDQGEHRDVLETYRLIAEDRGWLRRIQEAIAGGLTAEAAVLKVQDETKARLRKLNDPFLRERMTDFTDLANRLLQHLSEDYAGEAVEEAEPPDDMIVIAQSMGPAELLDYDRDRVRAVVLEEGSPTSHVAIVARALDIPVVGRVKGLLGRVEPDETVIVDGDHAQVFLRPGDDVQATFRDTVQDQQARAQIRSAMRELPAVTADGIEISLHLNVGLLVDMAALHETGVDGVGLYRTEIPFMVRSAFPGVSEQAELYERVFDLADGKPVVFRTLDIGGDKALPYLDEPRDENPAMGWRAIRIAMDRPSMLRQQMRALIRAAQGRDLHLMFPMISEVAEFTAARSFLDIELARAQKAGRAIPETVKVGAMLEVPALIWQLPALARVTDFVSVGSNDLVQFLYASDRGNPRLAERYDPLSPSVMTMLQSVVQNCDATGTPLTVCGEMASSPLEAMALLGLGYRRLSMSAPAVEPVKAMLRSLNVGALQNYVGQVIHSADHSLRNRLANFARDHQIEI